MPLPPPLSWNVTLHGLLRGDVDIMAHCAIDSIEIDPLVDYVTGCLINEFVRVDVYG